MIQPIPISGSSPTPPDTAASVYVARFGDTVESLLDRFGLRDEVSRQAFFDLNPRLAGGSLLTPGFAVQIPEGPRPASPSASLAAASQVETAWTQGYGRAIEGQNDYNAAIRAAQVRCPDVDPLILKSLLAQETGFQQRTFASNRYGYAGVAQLGIAEAHEAGLRTGASRGRRHGSPPVYDRANDERFDPSKAIPAAAVILRNKERALQTGVTLPSGQRLAGYETYGSPTGDDRWRFAAAAYNGGQGTILRAMRHAYGDTPPSEARWTDLVRSPTGNVRDSPLWRAIRDAGMNPAIKFREISEYAASVVARARQAS